jgi:hypothetical protein
MIFYGQSNNFEEIYVIINLLRCHTCHIYYMYIAYNIYFFDMST